MDKSTQMSLPGLEELLPRQPQKALTLREKLLKLEDRVLDLELEVTLLRAHLEAR